MSELAAGPQPVDGNAKPYSVSELSFALKRTPEDAYGFVRLKAKLAAEGLFEPSRKRPLPQTPAVIGVITSPTGAVIRDILHRIRDRWPCRVIVWPVVVQGDAAAAQVCAAIRGFNALQPGGAV